MSGDRYDGVPYTEHAYAESHPDRLAVVARLSGWTPPPIERSRILELGCGRGGNIVPMAASLPDATLLGIDASARQVDDASRVIAATGLTNVRVVRGDIDSVRLDDGSYDFIVCHGVFSWVPLATRRALLAGIGRWLAPGGVAYVSANTLPGWYERLAARDWLRFASTSLGMPGEPSAARASLAWLSGAISPELGAARGALDAVSRRLAETDPAYLVHEYLSPDHRPELVTTLLAEAGAAGLDYLGDATPSATAIELLPDDAAARAESLDAVAAQQLVDFVRHTAFRRLLLVRKDTSAARGFRWPARLDARAIEDLRVASRLRAREPPAPSAPSEVFDGPDGAVVLFDPGVRAALHELARSAPRAIPFADLARRAGAGGAALAGELLDLWLGTGAVDLHAYDPPMTTDVSARPVACAVARWHAAHGGPITNRWHQEVVLSEALVRSVLARLDGSRTIAELTADAASLRDLAGATPDERARLVAASVDLLAASALLTG